MSCRFPFEDSISSDGCDTGVCFALENAVGCGLSSPVSVISGKGPNNDFVGGPDVGGGLFSSVPMDAEGPVIGFVDWYSWVGILVRTGASLMLSFAPVAAAGNISAESVVTRDKKLVVLGAGSCGKTVPG